MSESSESSTAGHVTPDLLRYKFVAFQIPPSIACTACATPLDMPAAIPAQYYEGFRAGCVSCKAEVDWFRTIRQALDNPHASLLFGVVGASTNASSFELKPGEPKLIRFADCAIPESARVLSLMYGPMTEGPLAGGLIPVEMHPNIPRRSVPQREITIYPVPGSNEVATTGVNILIVGLSRVRFSPDLIIFWMR